MRGAEPMRQGGGPSHEEIVDRLAGFALFADLATPQLHAIAHRFSEAWFADGAVVLRQGVSGSGWYLILEGRAALRVDGAVRDTLLPGEFFGEISILLDEPPVADVVAVGELRCLVLPRSEIESFLLAYPRVTYRVLQAEARKVRNTTRWRS